MSSAFVRLVGVHFHICRVLRQKADLIGQYIANIDHEIRL